MKILGKRSFSTSITKLIEKDAKIKLRAKNFPKQLIRIKQKKQKAFGVFLTAGYPSLEYSKDIFKKILDAEVDFIEIGLPFSDPMADGPLIQHSSQIAIEQNTSVEECFKLVKEIRKKIDETGLEI